MRFGDAFFIVLDGLAAIYGFCWIGLNTMLEFAPKPGPKQRRRRCGRLGLLQIPRPCALIGEVKPSRVVNRGRER